MAGPIQQQNNDPAEDDVQAHGPTLLDALSQGLVPQIQALQVEYPNRVLLGSIETAPATDNLLLDAIDHVLRLRLHPSHHHSPIPVPISNYALACQPLGMLRRGPSFLDAPAEDFLFLGRGRPGCYFLATAARFLRGGGVGGGGGGGELTARGSSGAEAGVDLVFELLGVFLDDAETAFNGIVGGTWSG